MKAETILRLHRAEKCSVIEIADFLRMRRDNVQRVIRAGGWPRHRNVRAERACGLIARFRA